MILQKEKTNNSGRNTGTFAAVEWQIYASTVYLLANNLKVAHSLKCF
jgi:hypothetical protein